MVTSCFEFMESNMDFGMARGEMIRQLLQIPVKALNLGHCCRNNCISTCGVCRAH